MTPRPLDERSRDALAARMAVATVTRSVDPGPSADWTLTDPSRGLGDTVRKLTAALGLPHCASCDARQDRWNRRFPYPTGGPDNAH